MGKAAASQPPGRAPLSPEWTLPLCAQLMAGRAAAAPLLPPFKEKGAIVWISQSEHSWKEENEVSLTALFKEAEAALRLHSEYMKLLCVGARQPRRPRSPADSLYSGNVQSLTRAPLPPAPELKGAAASARLGTRAAAKARICPPENAAAHF